jgi:hypothetical protein
MPDDDDDDDDDDKVKSKFNSITGHERPQG